jgi:hypothetical protein
MSSFFKLRRARVAVFACGQVVGQVVMAQAVEDHSLPGSAIKPDHVKCPGGRLAMIRYDTRQQPAKKVCVSVQDGSRPQQCRSTDEVQLRRVIEDMATQVCQ